MRRRFPARLPVSGRLPVHNRFVLGGPASAIRYDAIATEADLVAFSRAALERAVRAYPVAVDLSWLREVRVSRRAKRRAAAVSHIPVPGAVLGEPCDWAAAHDAHGHRLAGTDYDDFREWTLTLSWRAFEAFDEAEWRRTLRHELLHAEQVQRFGKTGHGGGFAARCGPLETTRHCPSFHTGRYRIRCRDCGETLFDRCRRSKLTRIADSPAEEQRRRVAPSDCCGAYYRLVDTREE